MTLTAGTRLGRYEIRSKIGEGGMGEVYLAEDTKLDRKVALKILPVELAAEKDRMRRFIQEAKAVSALNHPNIVTIHEIDESNSGHFIATEFIDGETLRGRMIESPIKVAEALDIAIQIASALAATHEAGIIHRDIKPENVIVRRDGIVKVMDFGLAKLIERTSSEPVNSEGPTRAHIKTDPGVVMGTAYYMSPEQARGFPVDARTDIFSLGVLLYEMVANRLPFQGASTSDVISMILNKEPPALTLLSDQATDRLDEIVAKALAKDREHRYQVVKDLLIDLRRLKQRLEFESEVERTSAPDSTRTSEKPILEVSSQAESPGVKADAASTRASSAENIVNETKPHRKGFAIAGVVFALAIVAGAAYLWIANRRAHLLSDKDTIVLADFVNTTGDPIFDGTLKQALAVQLEQSPFLNIFSDQRVRDALRFMSRSPDERVTNDIAREICQRQGLKAYLASSISNLGSHYVITVEATNAQTGDTIAREQAEATSKEQVLATLGDTAKKLREKLGESLASIQKYDAPIQDVTTSSLEALKALSRAREFNLRVKNDEAIPFYKRAVELDPNFAVAYSGLSGAYWLTGQRELAAEAGKRAFDLRNRVSEREKLKIAGDYYSLITGEYDKSVESFELLVKSYPLYWSAWNNLGYVYLALGKYDEAVAAFNESIKIYPTDYSYGGIAFAFRALNRFDESKANLEKLLVENPNAAVPPHRSLYEIAFIKGDANAMQQQLAWANARPNGAAQFFWQGNSSAFSGQLRKARQFFDQGIAIQQSRDKEVAADNAALAALTQSVAGNCQRVKDNTGKALTFAHSDAAMWMSAMALGLCREATQLQPLIDQVAKDRPRDGILPQMRAAIEIGRNDARAIELLEPANGLYIGVEFKLGNSSNALWSEYLRGLAYLNLKKGPEAGAEFQTILDHRGLAATDIKYPLACLGAARAAVLSGDTAKARKYYQDFFALWKVADSDIPILIEAKKEYERF
jgi:eukaryotic-like serine/threonine-protein kinase